MKATLRYIYMCRTANMSWRTCVVVKQIQSNPIQSSVFKGKGKSKPLQKLSQMPRYVQVFAALGESWVIPVQLFDQLKRFTCALYGRPRLQNVDELRYLKICELWEQHVDDPITYYWYGKSSTVPEKLGTAHQEGKLPNCHMEKSTYPWPLCSCPHRWPGMGTFWGKTGTLVVFRWYFACKSGRYHVHRPPIS